MNTKIQNNTKSKSNSNIKNFSGDKSFIKRLEKQKSVKEVSKKELSRRRKEFAIFKERIEKQFEPLNTDVHFNNTQIAE